MRLLFGIASALSAAYRIILYSWLITVIVHQFRNRKEVLRRTPIIDSAPKRIK